MKLLLKNFLLSILFCGLFVSNNYSQDFTSRNDSNELKRMGFWDFSSKFVLNKGILVTRVGNRGTFGKLKIKKNDYILNVNGEDITKNEYLAKRIFNQYREGDSVNIILERKSRRLKVFGLTLGIPKQKHKHQDIIYKSFDINNETFRVIIKKPKNENNSNISLLFIPDFPCNSIDYFQYESVGPFINDLVKQGITVFLIEKHGLGDNITSKKCIESTFKEEVLLFQKGYDFMTNYLDNSNQNSFVFGHGIGSLIALEVGKNKPPKGKILYGTNFRPWSDYHLDRIRYHNYLQRNDLAVKEDEILKVKELFHKFYTKKLTPKNIAKDSVFAHLMTQVLDYKPKNELILNRNYKYWHQVGDFKTHHSVKENKSYLLSIKGKEDYENHIELDQKLVAELANTYKPNIAYYKSIDSLDHNFQNSIGAFKIKAIDNEIRPYYNKKFANQVADWIIKTNGKSNSLELIPAPRDKSLINLETLAKKITLNSTTTENKVSEIIEWANLNLKWVATDYNKRTAKEIISRGGGNCNEEAIVVSALLKTIGIKTRKIREINIQPDNTQREKDAKQLIKFRGNSFSVFGLRHNDHIWIEYFDQEKKSWQPADPTLNLVGMEEWIKARLGFENRITHKIINSQDMIAPFSVVVVDKNYNIIQNRSEYYLIDSFNKIYKNKLQNNSGWKKWVKSIKNLSNQGAKAFSSEINLHKFNSEILKLKYIYFEVKQQYK